MNEAPSILNFKLFDLSATILLQIDNYESFLTIDCRSVNPLQVPNLEFVIMHVKFYYHSEVIDAMTNLPKLQKVLKGL